MKKILCRLICDCIGTVEPNIAAVQGHMYLMNI